MLHYEKDTICVIHSQVVQIENIIIIIHWHNMAKTELFKTMKLNFYWQSDA